MSLGVSHHCVGVPLIAGSARHQIQVVWCVASVTHRPEINGGIDPGGGSGVTARSPPPPARPPARRPPPPAPPGHRLNKGVRPADTVSPLAGFPADGDTALTASVTGRDKCGDGGTKAAPHVSQGDRRGPAREHLPSSGDWPVMIRLR